MKAPDPFARVVIVLAGLAVAGLVAIVAAYLSIRDVTDVALQLPYVVSGVIGGVALTAFAAALLAIQATRRREAVDRGEFDRLVRAAAELLASVRSAS